MADEGPVLPDTEPTEYFPISKEWLEELIGSLNEGTWKVTDYCYPGMVMEVVNVEGGLRLLGTHANLARLHLGHLRPEGEKKPIEQWELWIRVRTKPGEDTFWIVTLNTKMRLRGPDAPGGFEASHSSHWMSTTFQKL